MTTDINKILNADTHSRLTKHADAVANLIGVSPVQLAAFLGSISLDRTTPATPPTETTKKAPKQKARPPKAGRGRGRAKSVPDADEGECYRLRSQGLSWTKVAKRLNLSTGPQASQRAWRWAIRHEKPWPVPGGPSAGESARALHTNRPAPVSEKCYQIRAETGAPWAEIAIKAGSKSGQAAQQAALNYARKHQLQWPIPNPPAIVPTEKATPPPAKRPTASRSPQRAECAAMLRRSFGWDWDTVAYFADYGDPVMARKSAERWWKSTMGGHLQSCVTPMSPGERVYTLAFYSRMTPEWSEFEDYLGLAGNAYKLGREWAMANRKPWPHAQPKETA